VFGDAVRAFGTALLASELMQEGAAPRPRRAKAATNEQLEGSQGTQTFVDPTAPAADTTAPHPEGTAAAAAAVEAPKKDLLGRSFAGGDDQPPPRGRPFRLPRRVATELLRFRTDASPLAGGFRYDVDDPCKACGLVMTRKSAPSAVEHWFECPALADFRNRHCADLLPPRPAAASEPPAPTHGTTPPDTKPVWGTRLLWTIPERMSAVLLQYARTGHGLVHDEREEATPGLVQRHAPLPAIHPPAEAATSPAGAMDEDDLAAFAH
jgi:hypothetical protein